MKGVAGADVQRANVCWDGSLCEATTSSVVLLETRGDYSMRGLPKLQDRRSGRARPALERSGEQEGPRGGPGQGRDRKGNTRSQAGN